MSKSDKKLLEENVINFFGKKEDYRSLSNFWMCDISIVCDDDRVLHYESGEHCFHGEKYRRIGNLCSDPRRKMKLLEYANTFASPSPYKEGNVVKKMGGKKGLLLNDDELREWGSIGIKVQREICRWKLENYIEVRNDLMKSGDKILVHPAMRCSEEKVRSRFWEGKGVVVEGRVVILGQNMLGNIWMEARSNMDRYLFLKKKWDDFDAHFGY